tara:strand:+ start:15490 stop:18726 length:3237 start_codon:yes stop_codon:yes gene_type:complete
MAFSISGGSGIQPTKNGPGIVRGFQETAPSDVVDLGTAMASGEGLARFGAALGQFATVRRTDARNKRRAEAELAFDVAASDNLLSLNKDHRTVGGFWGTITEGNLKSAVIELGEGDSDLTDKLQLKLKLAANRAGIAGLTIERSQKKLAIDDYALRKTAEVLRNPKGSPERIDGRVELEDYLKANSDSISLPDRKARMRAFDSRAEYTDTRKKMRTLQGSIDVANGGDKQFKFINTTESLALQEEAAINVGKMGKEGKRDVTAAAGLAQAQAQRIGQSIRNGNVEAAGPALKSLQMAVAVVMSSPHLNDDVKAKKMDELSNAISAVHSDVRVYKMKQIISGVETYAGFKGLTEAVNFLSKTNPDFKPGAAGRRLLMLKKALSMKAGDMQSLMADYHSALEDASSQDELVELKMAGDQMASMMEANGITPPREKFNEIYTARQVEVMGELVEDFGDALEAREDITESELVLLKAAFAAKANGVGNVNAEGKHELMRTIRLREQTVAYDTALGLGQLPSVEAAEAWNNAESNMLRLPDGRVVNRIEYIINQWADDPDEPRDPNRPPMPGRIMAIDIVKKSQHIPNALVKHIKGLVASRDPKKISQGVKMASELIGMVWQRPEELEPNSDMVRYAGIGFGASIFIGEERDRYIAKLLKYGVNPGKYAPAQHTWSKDKTLTYLNERTSSWTALNDNTASGRNGVLNMLHNVAEFINVEGIDDESTPEEIIHAKLDAAIIRVQKTMGITGQGDSRRWAMFPVEQQYGIPDMGDAGISYIYSDAIQTVFDRLKSQYTLTQDERGFFHTSVDNIAEFFGIDAVNAEKLAFSISPTGIGRSLKDAYNGTKPHRDRMVLRGKMQDMFDDGTLQIQAVQGMEGISQDGTRSKVVYKIWMRGRDGTYRTVTPNGWVPQREGTSEWNAHLGRANRQAENTRKNAEIAGGELPMKPFEGPFPVPGYEQPTFSKKKPNTILHGPFPVTGGDMRPLQRGDPELENATGPNSSESSMSMEYQGKEMLFPSVWMTKDGPKRLSGKEAFAMALKYQKRTGNKFPLYNTPAEATAASMERSARGGVYGNRPLAIPRK